MSNLLLTAPPYGYGMPDPPPAVRPATVSDAESIAACYRPYVEHTSGNFEYEAPGAAEMAGRIAAHPDHPWLVSSDDAGTLAGFAYAVPLRGRAAYQWTVETSVYATHPGRGVGGLLMRALLDACVAGGWWQAFAGIALPNEPSVALHERLGFSQVGTFPRVGFKGGRWVDVGWWHLTLRDGAR